MIALAPLLLVAAVQPQAIESDARRKARDALEQLLAGDGDPNRYRDYRGERLVTVSTRPRASDHKGICQFDRLEIARDPAGAVPGVEATHWFLVRAGAGDRPRWDLKGEALAKSCAAAGRSGRWFAAAEAYSAEAAVVGLAGLKEALSRPDAVAGTWSCRSRRKKACPDPKAIAERIEPLFPESVSDGGTARVPCPEGMYCVSVRLANSDCSGWVTQLRLQTDDGFRFHSARAGWQVSPHHCAATMFDPAEG
ncbi:MAG: hypothetical protein ABWX67_02905 [Allosphingosinicella sp.]